MIRNPKHPGKIIRRNFAHYEYISYNDDLLTNNCLNYFKRFEYRNPASPLRAKADFGDFSKMRHFIRNKFCIETAKSTSLMNILIPACHRTLRKEFTKKYKGKVSEERFQNHMKKYDTAVKLEIAEMEDAFREGESVRDQVTRPERYLSRLG